MRRRIEVDDICRTRSQYLDSSGLVFGSRGCVTGFVVSADGGNSGCTIYEGIGNKGRKMYRVMALAGTTVAHALARVSYVELGCYVELDDANIEVTIEYFPVVQKTGE